MLLLLNLSDDQDNLDEAAEENDSVDSYQEAVAVDTLAEDGAAIFEDCDDVVSNPGGILSGSVYHLPTYPLPMLSVSHRNDLTGS